MLLRVTLLLVLSLTSTIACAATQPIPKGFAGLWFIDYFLGQQDADPPPEKLLSTFEVDLSTGRGGDTCPKGGWIGSAVYRNSPVGTLRYRGTGQGCIPYGVGIIDYEDGSQYFGSVVTDVFDPDDIHVRPHVVDGLLQVARIPLAGEAAPAPPVLGLGDLIRVAVRSGYGQTTLANGTRQAGRYKADVLTQDLAGHAIFQETLRKALTSIDLERPPHWTVEILALLMDFRPDGKAPYCIGNCENGHGTRYYASGEIIEADWRRFIPEGVVTATRANGEKYVGEWNWGGPHGQGKMAYSNGDRYEGVFDNNKRSGYGVYYWSSGSRYEGDWVNNKQQGEGKVFDPAGQLTYAGPWKDGARVKPAATTQIAQIKTTSADRDGPTITLQRGINVVAMARHTVEGEATDPSGVAIVEVNGREASLDATGHFSADILLAPGENTVNIVAIDTRNNQSTRTLTLTRSADAVAATPSSAITNSAISTGQYYALILGVQDYRDDAITDLSEPLVDARNVKAVLQSTYTFEPENVVLLENPTRGQILDELDALTDKLTREDNLFIFYAGHGYWDARTEQGYWLPSDARPGRRSNWIPNGTIVDYINGIKTKHTLLVTDACFSGGIFKTRSAFSDAPAAASTLYKLPSRKAMTSGTLTEVPDKSVFVSYFIKRLGENADKYMSSEDLFSRFRTAVINNSPTNQVPQFGEIREAGDEGGDFIFVRR